MNLKRTAMNLISGTIPERPNWGPPLPRGFRVKWPNTVSRNMPSAVSKAGNVYGNTVGNLFQKMGRY